MKRFKSTFGHLRLVRYGILLSGVVILGDEFLRQGNSNIVSFFNYFIITGGFLAVVFIYPEISVDEADEIYIRRLFIWHKIHLNKVSYFELFGKTKYLDIVNIKTFFYLDKGIPKMFCVFPLIFNRPEEFMTMMSKYKQRK